MLESMVSWLIYKAGMDPRWYAYVNEAVQADIEVVDTGGVTGDKCVCVSITSTSGVDWHVSLIQDNVTVMAGQTYTAAVFLKADKARKATVEVKRSISKGDSYECIANRKFDIGTRWADYHVTFVPEKDFPYGACFTVTLGHGTGQVWVDGPRLSKGEYSASARSAMSL
jgi:hypothetical protein